jgi:hypothetical protein
MDNRHQASPVFLELEETCDLITSTLMSAGLELTIQHVRAPLAFAHAMSRDDDVVCTSLLGPFALLRLGVRIPDGEHPLRPSSVEASCSLERLGNGLRIHKRTGRPGWHAVFWREGAGDPALNLIRTEIFGETDLAPMARELTSDQVRPALERMARIYNAGR